MNKLIWIIGLITNGLALNLYHKCDVLSTVFAVFGLAFALLYATDVVTHPSRGLRP